jgi:hypothetical protein
VVEPDSGLNQTLAARFLLRILDSAPEVFPDLVGFEILAAIKEDEALVQRSDMNINLTDAIHIFLYKSHCPSMIIDVAFT